MAKYNIKTKYLVIYLVLIVFCGFLMICRWINHIEPNVKILPEIVLAHITNFALCLMLLLIIGYMILMFGGRIKAITILTIAIVVFNIVYECFLPFLNTSDITDALFGVCGTIVAYVYLVILKKNGLTVK
jgi:hypothetical protein